MTSTHPQRLEKASGLRRCLLAVLVGLLTTLALIVSGAAPASAQNVVGPRLPDQGSPAANWKQNSGVLRQVMSRGTPIRDASVDPATGALTPYPGSFLNAERNLLQSKGWTYDPKTTLWSPGG